MYASEVDGVEDLVDLLSLVAQDRAPEVIVAPRNLLWLVHPYDGGMDVIGGQALREQFAEWASPPSDGL